MDKLFTLLELQKKAQDAQTRAALIHIIVNDTLKIIPYTQAIWFTGEGMMLKLEKASGNTVIDPQSTYAGDIRKRIREKMESRTNNVAAFDNNAVLFFNTAEEGYLGGLWIERDVPFLDAELRILEELSSSYAQSLALWRLRASAGFLPRLQSYGRWKKALMIGAIVLALCPVRLGITAPAEIVARKSEVVTTPFDGMIAEIHVEPGDHIKKDDLLVSMENQALKAQMDLAQQEILVAQSALSRMQRESLASPEKKMNLVALQEDIESKRISYEYAKIQMDRSEIRSAADGIAIFSGSHPLEGKPVYTGEKLMMIANPADYEVQIRVPVESMVPVPEGADISFFLNVSPLRGHDAKVRSVGYQASADPDGLFTYKITAVPASEDMEMRIGWKGTARIEGEWTILSYAIIRRPVITLRNLMGI